MHLVKLLMIKNLIMMDQIEKFKRLEKKNYFIITKIKDVLLQTMILEDNSKDIGKNLKII